MNEYIPSTDRIRSSYAPSYGFTSEWGQQRQEEFDRWLEAHDREVAARAWDEGHADGYYWTVDNPYKEKND